MNATGTWGLAGVSVGEFLAGRRGDFERLVGGVREVCRFDDAAMGVAEELGWFREYEVVAAHLVLWSGALPPITPENLERLDEPLLVRRMCRMAADLQLTEFLQAVISAAVVAGTEAGRGGAARIVDVLAIACDLADATGGVDPGQVFRMWRVAHLPRILHPTGSDAPEYGKAGFRAYDAALEELLFREGRAA
ncbi:hypothetical protein [Streptomyces sp. S.PB5]|uniref:hypothetical protein n=1 Tax=Streptomyces sp. S.PB5 TaxID=3020844 RepID=UPI0025B1C4DC|nr:hypothetical protein [Streptomyces sp. S.PB5]MDN3024665.1 hypothetical protein [Streptomyces sp. S.PB5]